MCFASTTRTQQGHSSRFSRSMRARRSPPLLSSLSLPFRLFAAIPPLTLTQMHAAFTKDPKPVEPPADAVTSVRFLALFCAVGAEQCAELPMLEAACGL